MRIDGESWRLSAGVSDFQNAFAHALKFIEVRSVAGEFDTDAANADLHFAGDFDEHRAPCTREPFAQWIGLTATVTKQLLEVRRRGFLRSLCWHSHIFRSDVACGFLSQSNEHVQRRSMQVQPKEIRHEAMVAEAISTQLDLSNRSPMSDSTLFLVAIFTFTALGITIVNQLRFVGMISPIGHHCATVEPLLMHLNFDHHPPRLLPRPRLIINLYEQSLFLVGAFVFRHCFLK